MPVKLDFEAKYRTEADPWGIGDAASPRYDTYRSLLLHHAIDRSSILDVGCGLGTFLARFQGEFSELVGVDVSQEAVRRARELNAGLGFVAGSAIDLDRAASLNRPWGAVVFSDVINYFKDSDKAKALKWIAAHLAPNGVALIAAWSPGGRYLDPEELRELVGRHLDIVDEAALDTGHVAFVAKRRRLLVSVTVDYETWQPIPPGRTIDWDADVFRPCEALLGVADELGIPVTIMAEMGEHLWLDANEPHLARRMELQWQEARLRGHDVQLHLHPAWLPELGASRTDGSWSWPEDHAKPSDYPFDLTELLERCRGRLEEIIRVVDPSHEVSVFRAGAYQVQPSLRLYRAMASAGIRADSSVWAGGHSTERGYDFRHAYSDHQPYHPSPYDVQLRGLPVETDLVELPIWTQGGQRWSFDGVTPSLSQPLRRYISETIDAVPRTSVRRAAARTRALANRVLHGPFSFAWPAIARWAPRSWLHRLTAYGPQLAAGHEYFVMIGHTKVERDVGHFRAEIAEIQTDNRVEFVTLSLMAREAESDLSRRVRHSASEEAEQQVAREYSTVMGTERNDRPARVLQELIPLDSSIVLDLGCGAGDWSAAIARAYPWTKVVGVDAGRDFVDRARHLWGSDRVEFREGDFLKLPVESASIDCVYADNSLGHAFDLDGTLAEIRRVLKPGGYLVAAIPEDGLNPRRAVDNHTWKTVASEVREGMMGAGLDVLLVQEVDLLRLHGAPYPPSNDRLLNLVARSGPGPECDGERVAQLVRWVYERLDPASSHVGTHPAEILRNGSAWCWGYAHVLRYLLQQHGLVASQVSMAALDHKRGRGPKGAETHEVVVASVDGREVVLDAMANTVIPHALTEVLAHPELALEKALPDARYRERNYALYDTSYWYERVSHYSRGGRRFRNPRMLGRST